MLRTVTFIIAIIGYIFAGVLGYFAFYPLSVNPKKELEFEEILLCNKISHTYRYKDMTDELLLSLKSSIGTQLPFEQIKEFVKNIDKIAEYTGQRTVMNIDYCDLIDTEVENLNQVEVYLSRLSKYFEFSTLGEFVAGLNELPIASIGNFGITANSFFARSSICNSSIIDSKLYLFTTLNLGQNYSKRVVLFTIQLEDLDKTTLVQKGTKNIIRTVHYLKAQISCNE